MESNSNQTSSFPDEQSIISIKNESNYTEIISSLLQYGENKYFLCKECKTTPSLKFKTLIDIIYSCKCKEKKNIPLSINSLIQEKEYIFKKEDNKDNKGIYLKCNKHEKKFKYYCSIHEIDLCEDCFKEHKCEKNNIKNLDEEKSILDN